MHGKQHTARSLARAIISVLDQDVVVELGDPSAEWLRSALSAARTVHAAIEFSLTNEFMEPISALRVCANRRAIKPTNRHVIELASHTAI